MTGSPDKNTVELDGRIIKVPVVKLTTDNETLAETLLETVEPAFIPGKPDGNQHHIIVAWDDKVEHLRAVKLGQRITVFGKLHTNRINRNVQGVYFRERRTEVVVTEIIPHHDSRQ